MSPDFRGIAIAYFVVGLLAALIIVGGAAAYLYFK